MTPSSSDFDLQQRSVGHQRSLSGLDPPKMTRSISRQISDPGPGEILMGTLIVRALPQHGPEVPISGLL